MKISPFQEFSAAPLAFQVSRTAFYHVALTADGELLTWSGADERSREYGGAVAVGDIPPIAMLDQSQGMCHSTQSTGNPAACTSGYTRVDQHASAPMVLRVLADRAAVADVACGQQHTLALLETGQVRFAMGGTSMLRKSPLPSVGRAFNYY